MTKAGADGQISGWPERRWLGTRSWEKGRERTGREAEEEARKTPGHGDQSGLTDIGLAQKEMARNQVPREREGKVGEDGEGSMGLGSEEGERGEEGGAYEE